MPKKTANVEAPAVQDDVVANRREENDRRSRMLDRRKREVPVALDRRSGERRVGERRRQVDPTTCEREYSEEELQFMQAIDQYKRDFCRPFPTWSEVLEVCKSMGYRKVAEPTTIILNRAKAQRLSDEEDADEGDEE